MEIDIIVEAKSWEDRENFPYDDFRNALKDIGIDVWEIRFVR